MTYRLNALDQELDIKGSRTQISNKTLTDETSFLGQAVTGQTGAAASVDSVASGIATISGLTGMTTSSVGRFLTLSGADSAGNNGTFLIVALNSATSVDISNASAVAGDANNGSIVWTERQPYSLEDDLNFERTDRTFIKGVAFDADVPTYDRPTAVGTLVPANLANIAGNTLDAHAWVSSRKFEDVTVADGYTFVTLTDVGNLKHADAVDRTGVPINDGADLGNNEATYVEVVDGYFESEINVLGGIYAGYRVFGRTRAGSSTSPDSVEVEFRAVAKGDPISTSVAYTWEAGQPTEIDLFYGYRDRLDLISETAFRTTLVNGLIGDVDSSQDVSNILQILGVDEGDTSLAGLLSPTTDFYPFSDLPDATPSVVEALNTLNLQIGDRDYTGTILTDGYTITQSLQQLADAIANVATVTRTIERLSSPILAGTEHTLPGGLTYTLDATDNGNNLWVFWRGALRDPGPVIDGNNYEETSTTSITVYSSLLTGDHINYFIRTG